jgi:putative transposase
MCAFHAGRQPAGAAGRMVEDMPRAPRVQAPGRYHTVSRGVEGRPIFLDDADRLFFLRTLGKVATRYEWRCFAYCLMTNHFHLLVEISEPNLGAGMQYLNGVYCGYFNRKHARYGHLVERRYHSVRLETEEHAQLACRYVPVNPVRAGICRRPRSYEWSSYAATIGAARCPPFLAVDLLLSFFEGDSREARLADYVEFVASAIEEARRAA